MSRSKLRHCAPYEITRASWLTLMRHSKRYVFVPEVR